MMQSRQILWIGIAVIVLLSVAGVLLVTLNSTNPAFDTAVRFANAAGKGDDSVAFPLLSDELQTWVQSNCPDASVSACIQGYIPPEWGGLISAVFRRSAPDGAAWDVEVIATYEEDTGVSGVCSYFRMQPDSSGQWRIHQWAGFVWCGDPSTRNIATNPDTPNRVP
ncbi:MAG: hypothetical protein JNJ78_21155 [Anaerolineae bacterium]|nr:hypothetical protein [Anaerolineae bacterium]